MSRFRLTQEQVIKIGEVFDRYTEVRPGPERNLDQFWATRETVIRRVEELGNIPNISRKQIIFLGDDDLTSIASALSFKVARIKVIDIDARIIDFLRSVAQKEKLPIETLKHDLRHPLPRQESQYDIAFFDPPYTPQALTTWLNRAMEATLGKGRNHVRKKPETLSQKYYFLCYGYTDRESERGLKIQEIITSMGLVIQEKFRDFNYYHGAESIGSKSDLFLIQPTPKVNVRKLDVSRSQFYTGRRQKP